jgi:hypothetical protein
MRRILSLFCIELVLLNLSAFGAAITSNVVSTAWSATGSWVGGVVPGNGDTVTIANGANIHVTDARTVGASPASGSTAAIALGTSGTITIDSGGSLNVRGDMSAGTGSTTTALLVSGGGTFTWDSTAAPAGTHYTLVLPFQGWRPVIGLGTSTSCAYNPNTRAFEGATCAIITSLLTGSGVSGNFGHAANSYEGNFACDYCAISNLGDSVNSSLYVASNDAALTPPPNLHLYHTSLKGSSTMSGYYSINVNLHNFDISSPVPGPLNSTSVFFQSHTSFPLTGLNISDGVIESMQLQTMPISPAWTVTRMFFSGNGSIFNMNAVNDADASNFNENIYTTFYNGEIAIPSRVNDYAYFFGNVTGLDNPHFNATPFNLSGGTATSSHTICESPDSVTTDTGECALWIPGGTASPTLLAMTKYLLLPGKNQQATSEFMALVGTSSANNSYTLNHGVSISRPGAIQFDETGTTVATINSVRGTIMADLTGASASAYKLLTLNPASPSADRCLICDYNGGYNLLSTQTCTNCTNQGNGYAIKSSAVLGTHDIDVIHGGANSNPRFLDTHRRFATWDTKGFPNRATGTAWVTATAYAVGQTISVANSGTYFGDSINYTCTVAHTSGATTKPDSGASWRTNWEYTSVQDIRAALVNGTTYAGSSPAKALIDWVGAGWQPQAPIYWQQRAFDSLDLGWGETPMNRHIPPPPMMP